MINIPNDEDKVMYLTEELTKEYEKYSMYTWSIDNQSGDVELYSKMLPVLKRKIHKINVQLTNELNDL